MSDPYFHPTAIVEQGAAIGEDTKVWHHAHVRAGAVVGRSCSFGKNVFVDAGVSIGDGVRIQNNVSVYAGVTLEDRVFVGPSAVFTNDLFPRAGSESWSIVETVVREGASIGANATVVCGCEIGRFATVAAGSTVTHDVVDHQLVMGVPARPAGWMCRCGRVATRQSERPADLRCAECRKAEQ